MVGVAVRPRVGTAVDVGGPTSSRELLVSVLPWQELEDSAPGAPNSAVMSLSERDIGSTASTYLAVRLITCDEDHRRGKNIPLGTIVPRTPVTPISGAQWGGHARGG